MAPFPSLRTTAFATAGALLAVWVGFAVAREEYAVPVLAAVALGALFFTRFQPWPLPTLLLGAALFGNIVGNRGFAQLYVAGPLPLLPAEAVLLVGCTLLLVRSVWRRELPFRRSAPDVLLVFWLLMGGGRLLFDFRANGFVAVRDSAMVYYALFYFLAQEAGRDPGSRRWLLGVITLGCSVLPLGVFLFNQFPGFFLGLLTVRGTPVIYYKGDLAGIFMAVGSLFAYLRSDNGRRPLWVFLSLFLAASMLATNNRASMLSLGVAVLWLLPARQWRFAAWLSASGIVAAVVILLVAHVTDRPWSETPLLGAYERVISLTDPLGQRSYTAEDAADKGDNNAFRIIWWRVVLAETLEINPYTGLGFGHDLAAGFLREYYPDAAEEFTTRSPHNFFLTVFARMGAVGFLPLGGFVWFLAVRTWRAGRELAAGKAEGADLAPWVGAWIILAAACFGVVLEGPMGAVVFWSILGLASAAVDPPDKSDKSDDAMIP